MNSGVVGADQEGPERAVQFGQRQFRIGCRLAVLEVAGQLRQQFGVEGSEQTLDLAASLRTGDGGVDEFKVQVHSNLLKMFAGEVAAVVDIEHVRNPAHSPERIGLPPDRLPKRKRCLESRGRVDKDRVAGQGARVVIDHGRQPRPDRFAACVSNQHVELSVVGLPDCVRVSCTMAVYQLELVAEASRTFVSEHCQGRIEPRDDGVYGAVRRRRPSSLFAEH